MNVNIKTWSFKTLKIKDINSETRNIISIFVFMLFTALTVHAQVCGTDLANQQLLDQNPQLKKKVENQERQINQFSNNYSLTRSQVILPIVFHIVYPEERDSITRREIDLQLEQLNKDFNALNNNIHQVPQIFKNDIGNVELKFCLTTIDETGDSRIGIEQRSTSIENFGETFDIAGNPKIKFDILGGFDVWESQHYINVWVAELSTISGQASFPGTEDELLDGIIIDFDHFGNSQKTLTHEMGHYFNLKHLWGDEESCSNDDLIDDTPLQNGPHFDCPNHPQISCESADMFMNFMDYTNDACLSFFSKGQKNRMYASLMLFRNELLHTDVCQKTDKPFELDKDLYIYQKDGNLWMEVGFIPNDPIQISIYDILGRFVYTQTIIPNDTSRLEVGYLTKGVYFIVAKYQNEQMTFKVLYFY